LICEKKFNNKRTSRQNSGDPTHISPNQFFKASFCSVQCSGISQRGISKPKHSKQWKLEQSKRTRGKNHPLFGKKHSIKTKIQMSLSRIKGFKNGTIITWSKGKALLNMRDTNSNNWKGKKVGYYGLHAWVKRKLGTPHICSNCKSEASKKYEWCSIEHLYKRDIKNWIRLCTKCHRNYDYGNIILNIPKNYHSI